MCERHGLSRPESIMIKHATVDQQMRVVCSTSVASTLQERPVCRHHLVAMQLRVSKNQSHEDVGVGERMHWWRDPRRVEKKSAPFTRHLVISGWCATLSSLD